LKKYKKVLKDEVDDVICDVCGDSCRKDCSHMLNDHGEYATLEAIWGYCSRRDGDDYKCDMCENCFEKVLAFIDSLKSRQTPTDPC